MSYCKLILLCCAVPMLTVAAEPNQGESTQSYYSAELFTDVSGSSTQIFDANVALASRNRLLFGIGRSETPSTGLGRGYMVSAGYATDPENSASYGINSEYWRLLSSNGNNVEVLSIVGSVTRNSGTWSLTAEPGIKKINIHRVSPTPAETEVISAGFSLSARYITAGKWSYSVGIEKNQYFGDAAVLQTILTILKTTGKAPFLASLARSRYYVEADYGFTNTALTLGLDFNRTIIQKKLLPSVYVSTVSGLSDAWSLQTQLGTASLDANSWFVSLGLTFTN